MLCQLHGHSITYRITTGPQQGRKVFTLQTLPAQADKADTRSRVAHYAGFSLHAGAAAEATQHDKLERLCRYVSRPAVSEKRLAIMTHGQVRYRLKTSYRHGATHVLFEPLDFIAKLTALAPGPRVHLTRFHGVFAPNSKHRVQVTPAKHGKHKQPGKAEPADNDWLDKSPEERHRAMTWMQRLKRVFSIDMEVCKRCGGQIKVISSIEDPAVIAHILKHLKHKVASASPINKPIQPPERGPLQIGLFD